MSKYIHIATIFVLFTLSPSTSPTETRHVILGNKNAFKGRNGLSHSAPAIPTLSLPVTIPSSTVGTPTITSSGCRKKEKELYEARKEIIRTSINETSDDEEKAILREILEDLNKPNLTNTNTIQADNINSDDAQRQSPPSSFYLKLPTWDSEPAKLGLNQTLAAEAQDILAAHRKEAREIFRLYAVQELESYEDKTEDSTTDEKSPQSSRDNEH
jgi:hypothetical protein